VCRSRFARRTKLLGAAALVLFVATANATAAGERRVVLVSLDGVRWQEVFRGAEPALALDEKYVRKPADTVREFVDVPDRARTLAPFLHDVVARRGMLIGDRDHGSCAAVANPYWFSYPGYNEMFAGRPDAGVDSNDKIDNPNRTVLEWLHARPGWRGKVRAFGSWDVFPFILNRKRSGLPVNAGFDVAAPARTPGEAMLNRVQRATPSPWATVRYDAFTFNYALESLRHDRPYVLYISLGEPDEYAHEGHYDLYLQSVRRCDEFLRELWSALQANPEYAGRTTLLVTTDHGRGEGPKWRNHGSGRDRNGAVKDPDDVTPGSDEIWFAAIGPGITPDQAKVYGPERCAKLEQVAATVLAALGLDWRDFDPKAAPPLVGGSR
jgi:hypothetical protein